MRKKIIVLLFILTVILLGYINILIQKMKSDLQVHYFNVEKADALLIKYKNKYMLIDTALDGDKIITYLKNNNIETLDYLIITHFDKDHVGGAYEILNHFIVKNVLQSNYPKDSVYYDNYIQALNAKNITPITIENDKEFKLSDLSFNVNGPNKIYDEDESNNSSLIVSIDYKNTSFLFTGDIENERIEDFISTNNKTYTVLKVPHHGNYHKNTKLLIENTKPNYLIISSLNEEAKMTELLNELNIKTYFTRNGDIDIYSDGKRLVIKQ